MTARAVALALPDGDILTVVHLPPPGRSRGTAVLLLPSFGWQEAASHRPVREWACALAGDGYMVARPQLPGAGDSADPPDGDLLPVWLRAVTGAADWLRATAAPAGVVAIGLGFGGLLAVAALAGGAQFDGLILWGVPDRGRTFLREQRSLNAMVAGVFTADVERAAGDAAVLELTGYTLDHETVSALEGLRLSELELPRGQRSALVLGRDGAEPDAALVERLRASGATVQTGPGDGYADLFFDPQQSVVTEATSAQVSEWLDRGPTGSGLTGGPAPAERDTVRCRHGATELIETPLWLQGERGRLFGVLTEPAAGHPTATTAVLLGAGALGHPGPNRSWVTLARRWAAHGVPTFRVDVTGIGEADGEGRDLLQDLSFYEAWRDRDTTAVLDFLDTRSPGRRYVLGGLCSGAYQGLRRGLADDRVHGLLLLNLYALEFTAALMDQRTLRRRLQADLVTAPSRHAGLTGMVEEGLRAGPIGAWRTLRRSAERAQTRELWSTFDRLEARGVRTLILLGESEPLLGQLRRAGILTAQGRWPHLQIEHVPSRDHMFRARWLQRSVHDQLTRGLERAVAAGEERAAADAESAGQPRGAAPTPAS